MKKKTATALWLKIDELCTAKSLTHKLHLKQRLYSYRMTEGTSLENYITVFKDVIADLKTLEVKYDKEDLVLFCYVHCSLHTSRLKIQYYTVMILSPLRKSMMHYFQKKEMKQLVGSETHG